MTGGRAPPLSGRALTAAKVAALRAVANRCGGTASTRKRRALALCEKAVPADADTLVAYHDCLLFLLAYPEDAGLHRRAADELDRVAAAVREVMRGGDARTRRRLERTGVAWTKLTFGFGYAIARWLAYRHPRRAEIDSFDASGASLRATLRLALPAIEFEVLADESAPALEWLDEIASGRRVSRLRWLIDTFAQIAGGDALREQLFDALCPYITLDPGRSALSRSFVRAPAGRRYFHRQPLLRRVDPKRILDTPLPAGRPPTLALRSRYIDAARSMLASLGRETDAISGAWPHGVEIHHLGRGVTLALYTMHPERLAPLDSHVGFMLFKNGVPVAYGGGWPFLSSCRIGVNVFAPFRGGESAWLFCQVLRVYRQRFGIEHFIAEPSQFGAGNPEGLASGAFWFYYRLGFRPVKPRVAALAREEFARIRNDPGYRAPVAVLRRFTRSDIEFMPAGNTAPDGDSADLSLAVTAWIGRHHHGDRAAAVSAALAEARRSLGVGSLRPWSETERNAFAQWSLLLVQIPDLRSWSAGERRAIVAMIRAKGSDEFEFHDRLRGIGRLQRALAAVASGERSA